jgi:hypothetical protein
MDWEKIKALSWLVGKVFLLVEKIRGNERNSRREWEQWKELGEIASAILQLPVASSFSIYTSNIESLVSRVADLGPQFLADPVAEIRRAFLDIKQSLYNVKSEFPAIAAKTLHGFAADATNAKTFKALQKMAKELGDKSRENMVKLDPSKVRQ